MTAASARLSLVAAVKNAGSRKVLEASPHLGPQQKKQGVGVRKARYAPFDTRIEVGVRIREVLVRTFGQR